MDVTEYGDWLQSTRRELHRRPEPAWREYHTTARIVEMLRELEVDEIRVGPEILADGERAGFPADDDTELGLARSRGYEVAPDPVSYPHLELPTDRTG